MPLRMSCHSERSEESAFPPTPQPPCQHGIASATSGSVPEAREQIPHKRKSPRQRNEQDLFSKRGTLLGASSPVLHVCTCLENQHRRVFREIDAASLAFTALFLNMPAGGAGEPQRCVTAGAELYPGPILMLALGALHRKKWWTRRDSNPRPQRCERRALPAELRAHESQYRVSI